MSEVRPRLLAALLASVLVGTLAPLAGAGPARAAESPVLVPSQVETVPVPHGGDAMDDPAIWVHPTDPARSLVLGNDKGGGLETYDLDGSLVQRLTVGSEFWGNVDVRQGVTVGGVTHDLVGANQRRVRFYAVDPQTRMLRSVTEGDAPIGAQGEGFCLYRSPRTQKVYGISITIQGDVTQFELLDEDRDGLLESAPVRSFAVGSEAEGCVADDETGALYISEEDKALWRYDAEPSGGTTRQAVDLLASEGGHLVSDIEGVTLVEQPGGRGYLIVSAQNVLDPNASYFAVYRREAGNEFVGTFRIGDGASSDDCDRTDGVAATAADLGPAFPRGVFVCQDNNNDLPGTSGNQNLKLVRLDDVVDLDGGAGPPPPPPPGPGGPGIGAVGAVATNSNSRAFSVDVPAGVRTGDTLLLFASQGSATALSGPGAGWTQVARQEDQVHATTVWRRAASADDAGRRVSISTPTWTKVALTLAAYRGADPEDPLAAVAARAEPDVAAAHETPRVPVDEAGGLRVSYWSDRTSASTGWTDPAGETRRATSAGTGGGRVTTLLTDAAPAVTGPAGSTTGEVTATADSAASMATSWTLVLRPGVTSPPPPVNEPPVARLTASCEDLACTFDGSASSDEEDSIGRYDWDFGDGAVGSGAEVRHVYDGPGSYEVSLTVTDSNGATHTTGTSVSATAPAPAPAPTGIAYVGRDTSNTNAVSFSVQVPGDARAGDTLLLFASQNTGAALTGPGGSWTRIGRVEDGSHVTTAWRRTATDLDPGSTVRLGTPTYTKLGLTLVAYRGVDAVDPVLSIEGAEQPGSSEGHSTPRAGNTVSGAWAVSYWSRKDSATAAWTAPPGEPVRALTTGSGGGRVSTLLTDTGADLVAGSPASVGGLVARGEGEASMATTWTLLLGPAG